MIVLPLDPARIREQFPAFAEPSLKGQAFFENAGGSYTSRAVLTKLDRYYRATKVQPYGVYPASQAAGEAINLSFERLAQALNVTADWIHFGPSASANAYVLGNAFAGWLKPGDAIIVTNQDHEANSGAWRKLAKIGIDVRERQIDPERRADSNSRAHQCPAPLPPSCFSPAPCCGALPSSRRRQPWTAWNH